MTYRIVAYWLHPIEVVYVTGQAVLYITYFYSPRPLVHISEGSTVVTPKPEIRPSPVCSWTVFSACFLWLVSTVLLHLCIFFFLQWVVSLCDNLSQSLEDIQYAPSKFDKYFLISKRFYTLIKSVNEFISIFKHEPSYIWSFWIHLQGVSCLGFLNFKLVAPRSFRVLKEAERGYCHHKMVCKGNKIENIKPYSSKLLSSANILRNCYFLQNSTRFYIDL